MVAPAILGCLLNTDPSHQPVLLCNLMMQIAALQGNPTPAKEELAVIYMSVFAE